MLVKVCSFAIWGRKNLCALLIKSDCIQTCHFLRKFAGKETILMNQMNEENLPKLIHISETSSTNTYMHDLLAREEVPEGSCVWADFQTAGRGQIGNVWESEAGMNLTFSIVLYPTFLPANRQFLISELSAYSVKELLDRYTSDITVKWPNDVYWKDRKICGMLIENDLAGQNLYASVSGIGINLNQPEFRGDAPNPVSLYQILGHEVDREKLMKEFLDIFYANYLLILEGREEELQDKYLKSLYRKDGFFVYEDANGRFEAAFDGIEPTGHLLLKLKDGSRRRYEFKEVKFILSA